MCVKNRHTNVIRISCTQEKEIFIQKFFKLAAIMFTIVQKINKNFQLIQSVNLTVVSNYLTQHL